MANVLKEKPASMTKAQKGDHNVNVVISETSGKAENVDPLITRGFPSILVLPQRVLVAV